jgi:hypothetical protein
MDISSQNQEQGSVDASNLAEPSFKQTYASIEALYESKVAKLVASKDLMAAEIKLSFSAILLSVALTLALTLIVAAVWILLNFGLGLIIVELTESVSIALISLLAINLLFGFTLFRQLKKVWRLVGIPTTFTTSTQGEATNESLNKGN